jgi:hypothetical protein
MELLIHASRNLQEKKSEHAMETNSLTNLMCGLPVAGANVGKERLYAEILV